MKRVIWAIIFGALFGGLIFALGRYDVAAIGPAGTEVGFSHINQLVHDLTGVNMLWYEITDYIGYASIAVCGLFALVGFVQMIKRRSLLKVDKEIWALGGLFIAVIACVVFFEKHIVNYRPIIMPGASEPEASFPSSHTMLVMTVMIAVMIISDRYLKSGLGALVRIVCFIVTLVTIGGRLWSGVHWFTDITGAILLSAALLFLFAAVVSERGAGNKRSTGYRRTETADTLKGYKPKH